MIDLSLNEDQQQIVDGAIKLLREHSPVSRLRPGGTVTDVHQPLAQWGWFGVGLDERNGGLGLGISEEALLYLEAGRFLVSPSILATTLAAHLADGEARSGFLDGSCRAGFAIPGNDVGYYGIERQGASDLVVFERDQISLTPIGAFSGARIDSFDEAVVVDKGALDRGRLGAHESADRALLLTAAMLAGIAAASCELAVDYAKVRKQFGQTIGSFQAIKHLCADMGMRAYAAEAQVKVAAVSAADAPASAPFHIRAAITTAMTVARANGSTAIQVHGGIGFTADCDVLLSQTCLSTESAGWWARTSAAGTVELAAAGSPLSPPPRTDGKYQAWRTRQITHFNGVNG